ncbi:protein of unknown function (plasmid) [Azospirillum baldaniorum]|uniref:Uncharacterized protein n=1 Tax=Azospirillum baldaniorum TaxID=1064539 RepID=A0A9P1NP07_9PROT|nr:protein of unknown function [Azospirillum baldaniorum]
MWRMRRNHNLCGVVFGFLFLEHENIKYLSNENLLKLCMQMGFWLLDKD